MRISILFGTFLLVSCGKIASSGMHGEGHLTNMSEAGSFAEVEVPGKQEPGIKPVVIKDLTYSVMLVNGLDFVRQKGERPGPDDMDGLRRETVAIVEISSSETLQGIFQSRHLSVTQDKAVQYYSGEVLHDLTLIGENQEVVTASGVEYDPMAATINKVRLFFFLSDINLNKDYKIKFHDRIFGSGLIQLKYNAFNSQP